MKIKGSKSRVASGGAAFQISMIPPPAVASRLPSLRPAGRVAERGWFDPMTALRTVAILLLAGLTLSCSTKPQHVSVTEFQTQWEMRHAQTVHWCSYLGVSNGNVYMLRKTMPLVGSRWKEEVLFTETNGLPAGFVEQLRAVSTLEQNGTANGGQPFSYETNSTSPGAGLRP